MASVPGVIRNLGEGTLTIGNGSDYIMTNGSDITIQTSQDIEVPWHTRLTMISGRTYREQVMIHADRISDTVREYVHRFDRHTWFATNSASYTTSTAATTSTVNWHYPEEVTYYNPEPITSGTITFGDYSTMTTDNGYSWVDWSISDVCIKPATHAEVMQQKINEAWALYCRNENHTRNMQAKIKREWDTHLQLEKIAEAERIRLLPEKKANELMGMLIGEKELKVYKDTGRVFVKGKNGLYMVKRGGGMSKIEGNKIIDFCVHLEHHYQCPPTDHAIALKMMLEEDDSNVIMIANRRMSRTVKELPLAACM